MVDVAIGGRHSRRQPRRGLGEGKTFPGRGKESPSLERYPKKGGRKRNIFIRAEQNGGAKEIFSLSSFQVEE